MWPQTLGPAPGLVGCAASVDGLQGARLRIGPGCGVVKAPGRGSQITVFVTTLDKAGLAT